MIWTALHGAVSNANPAGTSQTGQVYRRAIKDANAAANRRTPARTSTIGSSRLRAARRLVGAISGKALDSSRGFQTAWCARRALSDTAQPPGTVSKLLVAASSTMVRCNWDQRPYFLGGQDLGSSILEGAVTGIGGARDGARPVSADEQSGWHKLAAARHLNATGQTVNPSDFRQGIKPASAGDLRATRVGVGIGASIIFNV